MNLNYQGLDKVDNFTDEPKVDEVHAETPASDPLFCQVCHAFNAEDRPITATVLSKQLNFQPRTDEYKKCVRILKYLRNTGLAQELESGWQAVEQEGWIAKALKLESNFAEFDDHYVRTHSAERLVRKKSITEKDRAAILQVFQNNPDSKFSTAEILSKVLEGHPLMRVKFTHIYRDLDFGLLREQLKKMVRLKQIHWKKPKSGGAYSWWLRAEAKPVVEQEEEAPPVQQTLPDFLPEIDTVIPNKPEVLPPQMGKLAVSLHDALSSTRVLAEWMVSNQKEAQEVQEKVAIFDFLASKDMKLEDIARNMGYQAT